MDSKVKFYMDVAQLASLRSKDSTTKVGAVLEKNGRILSIGYNGAPRNFPDDEVPKDNDGNELKDKKIHIWFTQNLIVF